MSLETISDVASKFKDLSDLQAYANKQFIALKQARDLIQKLQAEVTHLKELLSSNSYQGSQPELIIKSTEQSICEVQIEKLRESAMERPLTLEETKRLDLLVKNLLLCKGAHQNIKTDYSILPKGLTSEKLLSIASASEDI